MAKKKNMEPQETQPKAICLHQKAKRTESRILSLALKTEL